MAVLVVRLIRVADRPHRTLPYSPCLLIDFRSMLFVHFSGSPASASLHRTRMTDHSMCS